MSGEAPLDRQEFARWRSEADRALEGARIQAEAGLHNWACFAAEQAPQLAVKGMLHGLGRGPWGHDLVRFGEELGQSGLNVPAEVADRLRRLSRHHIPARYPDAYPSGAPGPHYGAADSAEAIADALAILQFVDELWTGVQG